jgi:hypothetical protein
LIVKVDGRSTSEEGLTGGPVGWPTKEGSVDPLGSPLPSIFGGKLWMVDVRLVESVSLRIILIF